MTTDHSSYNTCKTSFNKLMTEKETTFKEYRVDEFLSKLFFTINLYENGKYCTKCKKMKNIGEFGRGFEKVLCLSCF